MKGIYKRAAVVLVCNCVVACIPPLLLLSLLQNVTAARIWGTFQFSLVYANCIGTLGSLAIPMMWVYACRYPMWLQWIVRIAALLLVAGGGSLLACLVLMALGWIPPRLYWPEFLGSLKIAIFLTFLAGGVIAMYETMRKRLEQTTLELRTKELERERALKLATEAQLASLESRIHPHFLFNTLNSISSLIPEDPARAERLVEQMAALLRFSLDAHQKGVVPLSAEIKVVADYLEIERARFGDRLRYRIDVAAEMEQARVPPLSIQTLVENSVKYAVAPSRSGGEIRIGAARDNGLLRLEVADHGPAFALETAPAGHGLDNLRSRLQTLFGGAAALTLERRGDCNHLVLCIPQPHP